MMGEKAERSIGVEYRRISKLYINSLVLKNQVRTEFVFCSGFGEKLRTVFEGETYAKIYN